MDAKKDYYAILGVLPSVESVVMKPIYHALLKKFHPDVFSGTKEEAERRTKEINEAYGVLSDPVQRTQYDEARDASSPHNHNKAEEKPEPKQSTPEPEPRGNPEPKQSAPEPEPRGNPNNIRALVYFASGGFLLTVLFVLYRILDYKMQFGVFQLVFLASLGGLLLSLPVVLRARSGTLRTTRLRMHIARSLVGYISIICFFQSMFYFLVVDAVAINFFGSVLVVAMAALFLGEVVGWRRAIVTMIGFVGVLMILRPSGMWPTGHGSDLGPGALTAVGAAVAGSLVVVRFSLRRSDRECLRWVQAGYPPCL